MKKITQIKLEVTTEDEDRDVNHGGRCINILYFSPREVAVMGAGLAVLNDIRCSDGVGLVAAQQVIDAFVNHMQSVEDMIEPEQLHQLFHRVQSFFKDRNMT